MSLRLEHAGRLHLISQTVDSIGLAADLRRAADLLVEADHEIEDLTRKPIGADQCESVELISASQICASGSRKSDFQGEIFPHGKKFSP